MTDLELRRRSRAVAALLLASLVACASGEKSASAPTGRAETRERLARDVAWLASDDLEGRKAGSPAADRAADALEIRFEALGLRPAGTQLSYGQVFELPPARRLSSQLRVEAKPTGIDDGWWSHFTTDRFVATLASAPGTAHGPLVDLGDGSASVEGNKDANGSWIALARLRHESGESLPGSGPANPHAGVTIPSIRSIAFAARQRGAAGLIVLVDPTVDLPRETGEERDVAMPVVLLPADEPEIRTLKDRLASGNGADVTLDAGVEKFDRRTRNVLGLVPGNRPDAPILVVGAHYDHLGYGGTDSLAPGEHAIHHGADDNASGSALVLELARRFAPRAGKLDRAIVFALWSGEEMGLLGSRHWVKDSTVPWDRVQANLNFDMVGRSRDRKVIVGSTSSSSVFADILREANAGLEPPLALTLEIKGRSVGGSDHMAFLEARRPALFFFTGIHEDYHKPTDTSDKIETATMAEIADLSERALVALAAAPKIDFVKPPEPPPSSDPASRGAEQGLGTSLGTIPDYGGEEGGVLLAGVGPGSSAAKAGMKKGDILVRVGAFAIDNIYDLTEALGRLKPGDEVEVVWKRGVETMKAKTILGRRRG